MEARRDRLFFGSQITALFKIHMDNYFYVAILTLSVSAMCCIVFQLLTLSSLLFYANIFLSLVWFVIKTIQNILNSIKSHSYSTLGFICFAATLLVWAIIAIEIFITSKGTLSVDYLKSAVLNFLPLSLLVLATFGEYNRRAISVWTNALISLFIIVSILALATGFGLNYYAGGLTLNFTNPNLTGLVYSVSFIILLNAFLNNKRLLSKFYYAALALVSIVIVFLTRCRTALLAVFVSIALAYIQNRINQSGKGQGKLVLFIIFGPIVLISLYLTLAEGTNVLDVLQELYPGTKTLYTRTRPWIEGFKYFADSPLFGSYSKAYIEYAAEGMMPGFESGQLTFAALFGLIPFVLYLFVTLICGMKAFYSEEKKSFASKALFAFFFVSTLSLSGAFMGSNGYNSLSILPIATATPAKRKSFVRKTIETCRVRI